MRKGRLFLIHIKVLRKPMAGVRKNAEEGLQKPGKGCAQSATGTSGGLSGGGITGGHEGRVDRDGEVGLFFEKWGKGLGLKGWIQH